MNQIHPLIKRGKSKLSIPLNQTGATFILNNIF